MPAFEILLVLLYAGLFSFLILRLKFFSQFQLPSKLIVAVFFVKIFAGIIYGILHARFYEGGDTYAYFNDSGIIFETLVNHPWLYLRLTFGLSNADPSPDIVPYKDAMMFYTTPGSYFLVRFHSILRLISFGYYNVHVVIFNFLTLIGLLYLFLFFWKIMQSKKRLLVIVLFLFPSILFWSSGMHKDGVSLAALGLLLHFSSQIFTSTDVFKRENLKNFLGFFLGCWVLLFVRNFWLLLLIPSIIAFAWTIKSPATMWLKFALVYAAYFGVAMSLNALAPRWDFLNLLVEKQNEFMNLPKGSIDLEVEPLMPTFKHFILEIPLALQNCLLKPDFREAHTMLQIFSAAENVLVLLILFTAFIFRKQKLSQGEQSLLWFCVISAFTIFIVIGIIVPILGALVRYKTVGVLFLLISGLIILKDRNLSTPR